MRSLTMYNGTCDHDTLAPSMQSHSVCNGMRAKKDCTRMSEEPAMLLANHQRERETSSVLGRRVPGTRLAHAPHL